MKQQKDSFIFYRSFFEAAAPLPDAEKQVLFNAICEYALNQTETELTPFAQAMFCLIKPQLDANHKRYENGNKGGRPKTEPKPKDNQTETKPKANKNKNVNKNDNLNENNNENDFESFWQKYPRKINKQDAKKAYLAALKKTTPEQILAGLENYTNELARQKTETNYIAHASSWLNGNRWEDVYTKGTITGDGLTWQERTDKRRKEAGLV